MPTFVFTYRPPTDYQAGTSEGMAAWDAWFRSMGADLLDIGRPVGESTVVGDCGSDVRRLGGYSLIQADDLAAASSARGEASRSGWSWTCPPPPPTLDPAKGGLVTDTLIRPARGDAPARPGWTLVLAGLGLFMSALDNMVVTTALPVIRVSLHSS